MLYDGTAMLTAYGAPDIPMARAWVRQPVDIGAEDAWREVTRLHAGGYLLRDAGVVDVVVAEPSRGDDVFTLVEDAPGKPPRELLAHVSAGGELWCVGHSDKGITGLRRTRDGQFETVLFTQGGATRLRELSKDAAYGSMRNHEGICGVRER